MMEFDKKAAGRVIRRLRLERRLSQEVFSGFAGRLNAGTYQVELISDEAGLHTVREYMDGVLMAETQVMFE